MINPKVFRRLFLPSASTFLVYAKGNDENSKVPENLPAECEKLIRALDLPMYRENSTQSQEIKPSLRDDNFLIKTVRCMREELQVFSDQFSIVRQQVANVFLTGKAHTDQTIAYLREPENTYPRLGAITAGALTGYLFALRKGRFKKLLAMSAGAGLIGTVVYPDESKDFGEEGLKYMKKYVVIGYHFLNGEHSIGHRMSKPSPMKEEAEKDKKKQYVPTPLQQEYLDIQSKLAEPINVEEDKPAEPPKFKCGKPPKPRRPPKPPHPDKCKCGKEKGHREDPLLSSPCMTKKFKSSEIPQDPK